jgi:hypothetical protein
MIAESMQKVIERLYKIITSYSLLALPLYLTQRNCITELLKDSGQRAKRKVDRNRIAEGRKRATRNRLQYGDDLLLALPL